MTPLSQPETDSSPKADPQDASSVFNLIKTLCSEIRKLPFISGDVRIELDKMKKEVASCEERELEAPIVDDESFRIRLEQIKRAYKRGLFGGSSLKTAARNLQSYLATVEPAETVQYWKARTIVYELNDILRWDDSISEEVFLKGQQIENELRTLAFSLRRSKRLRSERDDGLDKNRQEVIREQVLYCACRANELKRRGDPKAALGLFDWLLDFTNTQLRTDFYLTRATLSYHVGSVCRVLEQHSRAEQMFLQTLGLYQERTVGRANDPDDHLYVMRRQAMVIGLGFGWLNLSRGFLQRAEHAVAEAQLLLAFSSDPIVPAYVKLLRGTIKRCRAGTTKTDQLTEAVSELIDARDDLEKYPQHAARASWELALAYTQLGDDVNAKKALDKVEQDADHPKWRVNVHILKSRIFRLRREWLAALNEAEAAVREAQARDCNIVLPLVDAYVSRGEAYFSLAEDTNNAADDYRKALAEFKRALREIVEKDNEDPDEVRYSNPKLAAVCELRVAQCYARKGYEVRAKEHLKKADILCTEVEHQWVRELAEKVHSEMESFSTNFTISSTSEFSWNYMENVAKLRNWLLKQALRQTKRNYSAAANLIGVKRGTLYQWENTRVETNRTQTTRED